MPHSYNKIWVHALWGTKHRDHLISTDLEKMLYKWLYEKFTSLNCPARIINGMPDHIHCLFHLDESITLADVIRHVKAGSSHHINELDLFSWKFAWQIGYAAYSVSESQFDAVYHYIKNQKTHHKKQSFPEEYNAYLEKHGFAVDDKTTG